MLRTLYRLGAPRRVAMLAAELAELARERLWRGYLADVGYSVAALLGGGMIPTLAQLADGAAPDTRSEAEIAQEVIRRIEEG